MFAAAEEAESPVVYWRRCELEAKRQQKFARKKDRLRMK